MTVRQRKSAARPWALLPGPRAFSVHSLFRTAGMPTESKIHFNGVSVMNGFGISLYLSTGLDRNAAILKKAHRAHMQYAFTSLQISEENTENKMEEVNSLLKLCKASGISLIADVSPYTLKKMGCSSFQKLKKTAISYLRVDYGFSCEELVELSKDFHLVFNASTLKDDEIAELQRLHADFTKFSACHNFYPEPLTGLSAERVKKTNERMHSLGMKTMAFVAGDSSLRGPLYQGLPTLEKQRNSHVLLNMLQLFQECDTDICLVGDIDVSDMAYRQIQELAEGYISLQAEIKPEYCFLTERLHHDRPDSSDYVIRSQESRKYVSEGRTFPAEPLCRPRKKGSIFVANADYLRYAGELQIARRDLPPEAKVNQVGTVNSACLPYLSYIRDGMGFQFVLPSSSKIS